MKAQKLLLLFFFSICLVFQVNSQGSITSDLGSVQITFDGTTPGILEGTFDASGISTTPASGDLDEDGVHINDDMPGAADVAASFGAGTTTNSNFQGNSTGGVTTGAVYAFDVGGGNTVFGIQPSSSAWGDQPSDDGHVVFKIDNNSGITLTAFRINYLIYELNNEGRTTTIESYFTTDVATPNYGVAQATYTTKEIADGSPAWILAANGDYVVSGLNVPNGSSVYLRFYVFDGPLGGGSRDEIGIDNINITGASDVSLLPVELSRFDVKVVDEEYARLDWSTETESNNSHFLVQHSPDGRQFETIGQVVGEGDSNRPLDYYFMHENPSRGINYYRLQQFDFDGSNKVFGPRAVRFAGRGKDILVYPNPTANSIQLVLPDATNAWQIDLYDLSGRKLLVQSFEAQTSNAYFDLNHLPSGTYILRWQNGQEVGQERIIRW